MPIDYYALVKRTLLIHNWCDELYFSEIHSRAQRIAYLNDDGGLVIDDMDASWFQDLPDRMPEPAWFMT